MKTLVVHAHPDPQSLNAHLFAAVCEALRARGDEVVALDLYAEGFDPVMPRDERRAYLVEPKRLAEQWPAHVEALRTCEHLVFVYPVWFYGMPAMLKGWLERVWLPGVAFLPPPKKGAAAVPGLRHIRALSVVCTGGAPWWWLKVMGDPNKRLVMRGLRALMAPRCTQTWLQLHNMNNVSREDCEAFAQRVKRTFSEKAF
jgi:NAD(P)H dehydrogenase (quinone)